MKAEGSAGGGGLEDGVGMSMHEFCVYIYLKCIKLGGIKKERGGGGEGVGFSEKG